MTMLTIIHIVTGSIFVSLLIYQVVKSIRNSDIKRVKLYVISLVASFTIAAISGIILHEKLYYREHNLPNEEDVRNGYAEKGKLILVVGQDTTVTEVYLWSDTSCGPREQ